MLHCVQKMLARFLQVFFVLFGSTVANMCFSANVVRWFCRSQEHYEFQFWLSSAAKHSYFNKVAIAMPARRASWAVVVARRLVHRRSEYSWEVVVFLAVFVLPHLAVYVKTLLIFSRFLRCRRGHQLLEYCVRS